MIQCYRLMLHIAVTLRSNFLHLVTSSRTTLVTQQCCIMVLCYMSVLTLIVKCSLFISTAKMYSMVEFVVLVVKYIQMKSYVTVQCKLIKLFVCSFGKKPHRSVIKFLTGKFYVSGSVHNELKGRIGAKRNAHIKEVEDVV